MMSQSERFNLTVELVERPGVAPGIVRFRRWIKAALRGYGVRCISVREEPVTTEATNGK